MKALFTGPSGAQYEVDSEAAGVQTSGGTLNIPMADLRAVMERQTRIDLMERIRTADAVDLSAFAALALLLGEVSDGS